MYKCIELHVLENYFSDVQGYWFYSSIDFLVKKVKSKIFIRITSGHFLQSCDSKVICELTFVQNSFPHEETFSIILALT
jgi:hypothetical protein